jgi:hypothetical protein
LKKADRQLVGGYALAQRIPRAAGRRRVSLVITLAPGRRAPDPDVVWKSLLDALTACGLLVDDSARWGRTRPRPLCPGAAGGNTNHF